MLKRFVAILGTFVVSLVGFAAVAGSAHAASENGRCEAGEVCMWQHASFTGGRYDTFNTTANFNTEAYYSGTCTENCTLNDTVSSVRNYDSGKAVKFFEHASYGGAYFVRKAANSSNTDEALNLAIDRMTPTGITANDQFSSFCFVYSSSPVSQRCRQ
jgi:hypothetical protein